MKEMIAIDAIGALNWGFEKLGRDKRDDGNTCN